MSEVLLTALEQEAIKYAIEALAWYRVLGGDVVQQNTARQRLRSLLARCAEPMWDISRCAEPMWDISQVPPGIATPFPEVLVDMAHYGDLLETEKKYDALRLRIIKAVEILEPSD